MTTVYQLRSLVRRGGAGRHRVRSDTGRRPQYKQRLFGGRVALNYARPWTVSEAVLRAGMAELRLACEAGHIEICDQHGRRLDHTRLFESDPPAAETEGVGAGSTLEPAQQETDEPDQLAAEPGAAAADEPETREPSVLEDEGTETEPSPEPEEAPEPDEGLVPEVDAADKESPVAAEPKRAQRRRKRPKE